MSVEEKISVIGLGYVGLPMAVEMAKKYSIIGFDISEKRIEELKSGVDRTKEVESSDLKAANIYYTNKIEDLKKANFHIVAVPTPVDSARQPDMSILLSASDTVGQAIKKGDIVVFESTVYPGATEEDCIPVLEKVSGLKAGVDFKVGYSPERINPGDKEHTFTKIKKVVSAQDAESLERVAAVYSSVVEAGVYKAQSIKVAEAAKVIENTQRDLNIALMNELSVIFEKLNVDTLSVLEAAGTKWNFLPFRPGLVGGHCIGVDPYYLTYRAEKSGYTPQVILAGRKINDSMGRFVAQKAIKAILKNGHQVLGSKVTVLGLTFKENCPDLRNTRVVDVINELKEYGADVQVSDPEADPAEAKEEYGIELMPFESLEPAQAVIVAVAHTKFKELSMENLKNLMGAKSVLVDIKGLYEPGQVEKAQMDLVRI